VKGAAPGAAGGSDPRPGPAARAEPSDTAQLSPDDAPRACEDCERSLTVGERMFYFLEGTGTRPVCRRCMIDADPDGAALEEEWIKISARRPLRERYLRQRAEEGGRADALAPEIRRFLNDEILRIEDAIDRLPEREPDRALLNDLVEELRDLVESNRLSEAVVALRDVRRIVSSVERGGDRPALLAPWDEDVEQLYDRVVARSRAMSRPLRSPIPEDSGDASVGSAEPVRRSGAPS